MKTIYIKLLTRDGHIFDKWEINDSEDIQTLRRLENRMRMRHQIISKEDFENEEDIIVEYDVPITSCSEVKIDEERICSELVYGNRYRVPNVWGIGNQR